MEERKEATVDLDRAEREERRERAKNRKGERERDQGRGSGIQLVGRSSYKIR